MAKNPMYTDITIHILKSTAKIWTDEAKKQGMSLEEFIAKVLLDYKIRNNL